MGKLKDEDLEFLKENEEELREYIGKKADYYIDSWRTGKGFNVGGFLTGVFWLGYRGMYGMVLLIIGLFFVLDIVCYSFMIEMMRGPGIILGIVLGMQGNTLFFYKAKKDILAGRVNKGGIIGAVIAGVLFGAYAWISVKMYDYFFYYYY